ncbi:MAG: hypothetical protein AAF289_00435 [Cyanobacteria bacterium P01_A01_bin.135]
MEDSFLRLLTPWKLPLSQQLDPAEKRRVELALRQLLQALELSPEAALMRIDEAIAQLGEVKTQPADISRTKTALRDWEVEDYDRYFQLHHVQTQQSAACLVQGLLVTCRRFVDICCQAPHLAPQDVQRQQQGFASYARLLMRTFSINDAETL